MTTQAKKIKTKPSWVDVKEKLADIDRAGLMQLIADMYAADKINQCGLLAVQEGGRNLGKNIRRSKR